MSALWVVEAPVAALFASGLHSADVVPVKVAVHLPSGTATALEPSRRQSNGRRHQDSRNNPEVFHFWIYESKIISIENKVKSIASGSYCYLFKWFAGLLFQWIHLSLYSRLSSSRPVSPQATEAVFVPGIFLNANTASWRFGNVFFPGCRFSPRLATDKRKMTSAIQETEKNRDTGTPRFLNKNRSEKPHLASDDKEALARDVI